MLELRFILCHQTCQLETSLGLDPPLLQLATRIGTVSESIDAVKLCKSNGWGVMCSHRSGETEAEIWSGTMSKVDWFYHMTGRGSNTKHNSCESPENLCVVYFGEMWYVKPLNSASHPFMYPALWCEMLSHHQFGSRSKLHIKDFQSASN